MKKQAGFTLIELLIVIIILGILATYAVPKYMNIDKQARASVVNGLAGSIKSAAEMVHAIAIASNATTPGTVSVGSSTVDVLAGGYPAATLTGIGKAISDLTGSFDTVAPVITATSITYYPNGAADKTNCYVKYDVTTATAPATTTVTTSC